MAEQDPAEALQALARDWITLVQSELAAIAVDREAQETWRALLGLWAGAATLMINVVPRRPGGMGHDRPAATPGAATAAAAPDPRDAEIRRLADRLAELERRLDDAGHGGAGAGNPRPPRRRR
jgi:hypothetical protein